MKFRIAENSNTSLGGSKWKQGKYKLKNPKKYLGDPDKIIYRSSWEQRAFEVCDNNPYVLEWGSEIIKIPYLAPTMNGGTRVKNYYPDLYVVVSDGDGNVTRKLIEIKPVKQTQKPRSKKPQTRLYEEYTYAVNLSKWEAAKEWCRERGIIFEIATEQEMFGNAARK